MFKVVITIILLAMIASPLAPLGLILSFCVFIPYLRTTGQKSKTYAEGEVVSDKDRKYNDYLLRIEKEKEEKKIDKGNPATMKKVERQSYIGRQERAQLIARSSEENKKQKRNR